MPAADDDVLRFRGCASFRQRVVLATLAKRRLRIDGIRARGEAPGLRDHEASFLRLVEKLTNGCRVEINETGTTLKYVPGWIVGGAVEHDCGVGRGLGWFVEGVLPLLPFGKAPARLALSGVTNDDADVCVDVLKTVTLPTLAAFAIGDGLGLDIAARGSAPAGGGRVTLTCPVVRELAPVSITDEGFVKRLRGLAYATRVSPQMANRIVDGARCVLVYALCVCVYDVAWRGWARLRAAPIAAPRARLAPGADASNRYCVGQAAPSPRVRRAGSAETTTFHMRFLTPSAGVRGERGPRAGARPRVSPPLPPALPLARPPACDSSSEPRALPRRAPFLLLLTRASLCMLHRPRAPAHPRRGVLNPLLSDVFVYTDARKGAAAGLSPGYGVSLVATTTSGCLFGAQACTGTPEGAAPPGAPVGGGPPAPPEALGRAAADALLAAVGRGGCIDEGAQPLVFTLMLLTPPDVSRVRVGALTPAGVATLRLLERVWGVQFRLVRAAQTAPPPPPPAGGGGDDGAGEAGDDAGAAGRKRARRDAPPAPQPLAVEPAGGHSAATTILVACQGIGFRNTARRVT